MLLFAYPIMPSCWSRWSKQAELYENLAPDDDRENNSQLCCAHACGLNHVITMESWSQMHVLPVQIEQSSKSSCLVNVLVKGTWHWWAAFNDIATSLTVGLSWCKWTRRKKDEEEQFAILLYSLALYLNLYYVLWMLKDHLFLPLFKNDG